MVVEDRRHARSLPIRRCEEHRIVLVPVPIRQRNEGCGAAYPHRALAAPRERAHRVQERLQVLDLFVARDDDHLGVGDRVGILHDERLRGAQPVHDTRERCDGAFLLRFRLRICGGHGSLG